MENTARKEQFELEERSSVSLRDAVSQERPPLESAALELRVEDGEYPPLRAAGEPAAGAPLGLSAQLEEYSVDLEFFHGPMDLLLHLVARQEVPVEEVRMSLVAEQYLEIVVEGAERLDLEKAGEYLVIASTLLAIKSRALLPAENDPEEELPGDWAEGNPFFEDLRARLRAYHETQRRAEELRRLPQLDVDTFARRDRKLLQPTPEMLQEPEDVFSLGSMFVALLKRIGEGSSFRLVAQPFAVVDFMISIVDTLNERSRAPFSGSEEQVGFHNLLRFLRKQSSRGSNRTIVIGGFIAVLELMKRGIVTARVSSTEQFELGLAITPEDSSDAASNLSSEFDEQPESAQPDASELEDGPQKHVELQSDSESVLKMSEYRNIPEVEASDDAETDARKVVGLKGGAGE